MEKRKKYDWAFPAKVAILILIVATVMALTIMTVKAVYANVGTTGTLSSHWVDGETHYSIVEKYGSQFLMKDGDIFLKIRRVKERDEYVIYTGTNGKQVFREK